MSDKITTDQYLAALKTIREYEEQLKEDVKIVPVVGKKVVEEIVQNYIVERYVHIKEYQHIIQWRDCDKNVQDVYERNYGIKVSSINGITIVQENGLVRTFEIIEK